MKESRAGTLERGLRARLSSSGSWVVGADADDEGSSGVVRRERCLRAGKAVALKKIRERSCLHSDSEQMQRRHVGAEDEDEEGQPFLAPDGDESPGDVLDDNSDGMDDVEAELGRCSLDFDIYCCTESLLTVAVDLEASEVVEVFLQKNARN